MLEKYRIYETGCKGTNCKSFLVVAHFDLIYSTPPVLTFCPKLLKMAGTITRKALRDFFDSVKDDVCLIPSEVLAGILQDKQNRDDKLYGVLDRIATNLETGVGNSLKHFHNQELKMDQIIIAANDTSSMETSLYQIGEKLDKLTEAVTNSANNLQTRIGDDEKDTEKMKKNILKLKDLRGQYLRAEKMSNFSEELMNKTPPYVQGKFRMKVARDLPEEELECYRTDALHNARSENDKMKIRMRRWEEEIAQLNLEINTVLNNPNTPQTLKTKMEQQIKKDEEINQNERENAIKKIKETYETETGSGTTQFLLKYVNDDMDGDKRSGNRGGGRGNFSKNFRGQRPYRRPWQPRY